MQTEALQSFPISFEKQLKPIRAVVYARVSSDEQAKKEFSIPQMQIPKCLDLIRQEQWRFVKTYIDEDRDCNMFQKREELQKMLVDDIDTYDVVVCWSFDRLVGDDENTRGQIYHILDSNRKQITSARQPQTIVAPDEYDPKSLNVSQARQINNIGVSWDRKIRRERFMESRNKTVAGGRHITKPPYGYKLKREIANKEGERVKIRGYRVVNEDEAPILKRIFNERVFNGKGGRAIAIMLNEEGIRTRHGCDWTGPNIIRILSNPFPAGYILWNRSHERKFGDEAKREQMPKSKWQFYPVDREKEKYYEPLIKKELYDKAQELSAKNKKAGKAPQSRNILSGLVKCPLCKKSMVMTNFYPIKKPPYYKAYLLCLEHYSKGVCSGQKYRAGEVEQAVLEEVEKYLNDPEELEDYQKSLKADKLADWKKELKSLERKMKKCQERIYNLNVKYLDEKIKEDYYKQLLDGLEKEEASLRASINKLESNIKNYEKTKADFYRLKDMRKGFGKKLRSLDVKQKKLIMQALIEEIVPERKKDNAGIKGLSIIFKV